EVRSIGVPGSVTDLGAAQNVAAVVALGALEPDDVEVQLLHGPVGPSGELQAPTVSSMQFVALDDQPGSYCFDGSFTCDRAGRYGFTARVVPAHPDLVTYAELGVAALSQ